MKKNDLLKNVSWSLILNRRKSYLKKSLVETEDIIYEILLKQKKDIELLKKIERPISFR